MPELGAPKPEARAFGARWNSKTKRWEFLPGQAVLVQGYKQALHRWRARAQERGNVHEALTAYVDEFAYVREPRDEWMDLPAQGGMPVPPIDFYQPDPTRPIDWTALRGPGLMESLARDLDLRIAKAKRAVPARPARNDPYRAHREREAELLAGDVQEPPPRLSRTALVRTQFPDPERLPFAAAFRGKAPQVPSNSHGMWICPEGSFVCSGARCACCRMLDPRHQGPLPAPLPWGTRTTDRWRSLLEQVAACSRPWNEAIAAALETEHAARRECARHAPTPEETYAAYRARIEREPPDVFALPKGCPSTSWARMRWRSMQVGFADGSIVFGWTVALGEPFAIATLSSERTIPGRTGGLEGRSITVTRRSGSGPVRVDGVEVPEGATMTFHAKEGRWRPAS